MKSILYIFQCYYYTLIVHSDNFFVRYCWPNHAKVSKAWFMETFVEYPNIRTTQFKICYAKKTRYINFLHSKSYTCYIHAVHGLVLYLFALNYILCILSLIDWLIDWTDNIWAYIVRCPNESNLFQKPANDIFYALFFSPSFPFYCVVWNEHQSPKMFNFWVWTQTVKFYMYIMMALAKTNNLENCMSNEFGGGARRREYVKYWYCI